MQRAGNILLIENPCAGNSSLAAALRARRVLPDYTKPGPAREEVEEFSYLEKIIIVRTPVDRFLTACTGSLLSIESLRDDFPDFAALLEGLTSEDAAERIVEFIEQHGF